MACSWAKTEDAAQSALFHCATCNRDIRFVKTGFGDPHVAADATTPAPNDPFEWLGKVEECDLP